ncbi:MAG TPA: BTAD domain-containing putative transcriptional regulator [Actinocrinis sp.]|uniref:BTAD domain-containing putative transcriptional regulator n=1 Tax=Actinocrinis sp. TaxID=1920516 RepID=UPI002DDCB4AD|nr:BTAD domain-containing putative transcriptional regulator [Actinocrinis sp.]HEV2348071.1 BTAD domain-containing putative transcriptional regulator [Actinocrinis sp.]
MHYDEAAAGHGAGPRLAALLRDFRREAGLTQRELADRAGVSLGTVRDAEQGRTRLPRPVSLIKLAGALGLDDDEARQLVNVVQRHRFAGVTEEVGGHDGSASVPSVAEERRALSRGRWIEVLGPLRLWRDGVPVRLRERRARTILGLLALTANTPVHRDELIDAVWGSDPPATAASLTRDYVSALRRVLEPRGAKADGGVLESADTHYTLRLAQDELDLLAFRRLVADARGAEARGDAAAASLSYEKAMALWRGEPLTDWPGGRSHPRIVALSRTRAAVVCDYAHAAFRAGEHRQVLPHLEQLAAFDPLDETVHARLMLALAGSGRQAGALVVFDGIRRRLDEQLGIRPGAELSDVHLRVLRQEVPLARPDHAAAVELVERIPLLVPQAALKSVADTARPVTVHASAAGQLPTAGERAKSEQAAIVPQPSTTVRVVPRQLPSAFRHFCGRAEELKALTDALDQAGDGPQRGTVAIAMVDGTAGVGKTSLAVAWAHQVADRFPDGQLYADLRGFDPAAESEAASADVIRRFLDAFAVPPERIAPDPETQAALYRSLLADRRVLIVLDNAASAEQVRPLLPGNSGCAVVVTSRRRLTGLVVGEGAKALSLGYLKSWEARDLLARLLGPERVAAEPEAADALIELCAGLPLALSIVANRAAVHARSSLTALVAELRTASSRLDALSTDDETTNPRAALSWSYRKLTAAQARMFRLLGEHPCADVSARAAASLAGVPLRQARGLLGELVRTHLVEEHALDRYSMHDLVRAYAREEAEACDAETDRREAIGRVLDHYLHTGRAAAMLANPVRAPLGLPPALPGVVPGELASYDEATAWFEAEHKTVLSVIAHAAEAGFDRHAWQIPWTLTTFQNRLGHYRAWAWCQQTALAAARRTADLPAQADALRNLGRVALRLQSYGEALDRLLAALEIYRQAGDRSGQADAHLEIARVHDRTDRFAVALDHALLAYGLYQQAGDPVGPAYALNAAGWYCTKTGRFHAALDYCRRALDLHLGLGDSQALADTWDSLGYVHHHLGHTREALDCYEHAAELYEQLGARHDLAATLERIGDSREMAGAQAAARDAWRRALSILSGLDHSDADRVRAKLTAAAAATRTTALRDPARFEEP